MNATTADRFDIGQVTIDKLPDHLLLEIFDFCRMGYIRLFDLVWDWESLARVCRRWRSIIFASPQRLRLHLLCDGLTPTRTSLDIWPPFPIAVCYPFWLVRHYWTSGVPMVDDHEGKKLENVIAALERHDRITHIRLTNPSGCTLRRFVAVMLEPFVALTHLHLRSNERTAPGPSRSILGRICPTFTIIRVTGHCISVITQTFCIQRPCPPFP